MIIEARIRFINNNRMELIFNNDVIILIRRNTW